MRRRSLSLRLLAAMLAVAAVGALTLFLTARLLGPELFDTRVKQIGQRYGWVDDQVSPGGGGPGQGGGSGNRGTGEGAGQQTRAIEEELSDAFSGSLNVALAVALAAGAVTAVAGAVVVSRRVLRPLDRMRTAVRRMSNGHYEERVPEPQDRELAELAGDVNALGRALEATEERRARLVSDLAHELRTPIASLDGFLEGLEDGVFEPDLETLEAMRGETRRLQRLAADLSALSKADEQAFDLEVRDADLGALAADVARGLGAAFAASGVELEIEDLPPLPVRVDVDRIGQVFSNLLHNALRHTPRGGRVSLRGEQRGNRSIVMVTDTGEGIAPDDLGRVFDRFFRIGGESAAGGSGIGLTIARGIARAHGGDIEAFSEGRDCGATFAVSLPPAS